MERLLFRRRRMLFIGFTIIFWLLFLYIWGFLAWGNAVLFSKEWWLDCAGHYLAGTVWAWNWFFIFRNYTSPRHSFRLLENVFQQFFIFIVTLLGAFAWEGFEGTWDQFRELLRIDMFPAQSHPLDTLLDMVVTTVASIPVVILYIKTSQYFADKFPDEYLREEYIRFTALGEDIAKRLLIHKRERRRQMISNFKREMARVLKGDTAIRAEKHRSARGVKKRKSANTNART